MSLKIHLALALLAIGVAFGSNTARADVVAVVSAKNPVATLTKSQIVDIFLGKINRFPDGSPAMAIDQEEGSPARDEFYATFAGISAAQLRSHWAKIIFTGRGQPPRTVATLAELRKLLAANPQVIAYVERSAVDDNMKVVERP
jgi:ABC-type phosphate transport system substrate-binding protein